MANFYLNIAFANCKGQTGFNEAKQLQIEHFLITFDIDILHLQESHIDEFSFLTCNHILSNYQVIRNNSNTNQLINQDWCWTHLLYQKFKSSITDINLHVGEANSRRN